MKKITEIRFLLAKNKQAKRAIALVCFVVFMLGGIFVTMKILDEKERVSAHPTNPIKLDEGGTSEFEVPIDAQNLIEPSLTSQGSLYSGFVQTNSDLPTVVKGAVNTFWSDSVIQEGTSNIREIIWIVKDIRLTEAGNYFVLLSASGYSTGGIIGVCVINSSGEIIYINTQGDLRNSVERIQTKLFADNGGKDFLIGTQGNKFYRYSLSSETTSAVVVNRTIVDVDLTNSPNVVLGVGYNYIVDSTLNTNERTAVSASVYFDKRNQVNANASLLFRMPIATISIDGWMNTVSPNFSFDTNYEYSLESFIPPDAEAISGKLYGAINTVSSRITDNHVYGNYDYSSGTAGGITMKTIQVFDKNDTFYENGKPVKRRKVLYENHSSNAQIYLLDELCTDNEIYFVSTEATESKLIKIELTGANAYDIQEIKAYPKDTILNFVENPDDPTQLFYFGSTSSLTDEFYHPVLTEALSGDAYYVQGITDRNFDRKSLYAIAMDEYIMPDFMKPGTEKALIFGRTSSVNRAFVDNQHKVGETGDITEVEADTNVVQAFIGSIKSQSDFAPIIKAQNNIDIDLSHEKINSTETNSNGWTFLDNWLITGEENGTLSSSDAVNVYDYMDSRDSNFGQTWLDKRINRNPRNPTAVIDWLSLGFDKTKAGAQQVTYFVTDSQNQTSVASRWVNKKTNQTIEEDDYCLDAQNFHISLTSLDSDFPDEDTFKGLAKTMAWNKTSSDIDEDGTDSNKLSNTVTINATQLEALRDATVAKPYPVDVTYRPTSGVELTNRVWVFVTTTNTLPNSETSPATTPQDTNGVVFYGDDYTLPYRMRNTHTNAEAVTSANVKVYDYFDSTHEEDDELPTLADATKNANKLVVDLPTIQNSLEPETVRPSISYTWEGATDANHTKDAVTLGYVDVGLTGNALLHIRQVVLDSSGEIVVPTEGYFEIRNLLFDQTNPMNPPAVDPDYLATFVSKSGRFEDNPDFTEIVASVNHLTHIADQVQLSVIVPEFYQYLGYFSTAEQTDPGGALHETMENYLPGVPELFKGEINAEGEFWITLYLKPNEDAQNNTKTPQPYSWDYKKNNLGKIKTK
ncbi:hypothetical protein [Enterococcus pallens]|uniref:DUF5057 domain-containing protein n=1 Tax=Enterococcus pallens ATCC BAA-351 TaxID=1158607 RepID=R2S686_9ENTE|nr:hypothetical protein [Enterococcus pallens]EOH90990.1 hypothetical protein UAU_03529 [Enterococcus pallens ATCC BAA-351]EOU16186.1 hypothetical protein I588_03842 [Enterococcus pallens ATCC BAA-351]